MQNIITGEEKETIATKTFNCLSIVKIYKGFLSLMSPDVSVS
jgi:hypothetical protein